MRLIDADVAIAAVEKVAEMFPYKIADNRESYEKYNEGWSDATSVVMSALEDLPAAKTIDAVQMHERACRELESGVLSAGEFNAKIRPLRSVSLTVTEDKE
jgi:hypothetical protein